MDISVSDSLRAWVEAQIETGHYGSASDYVADLIRRDRLSSVDPEALAAALKAGEDSGISPRRVPDIMAALEAEFGGRR